MHVVRLWWYLYCIKYKGKVEDHVVRKSGWVDIQNYIIHKEQIDGKRVLLR